MDREVLAQIKFGPWLPDADEEWRNSLDSAFHSFTGDLLRSGQIIGDAPYGVVDGMLQAFVRLPDADSLNHSHLSRCCPEAMASLQSLFGLEPEVLILDHGDPLKKIADWQTSPWLVLFGASVDGHAPVRDHQCRGVPSYRLPLNSIQRCNLRAWAGNQANHHDIWLASGSLEIEAYKALADPCSELNMEGRKLAMMIETATGKAVYTEIFRYFSFDAAAELKRPCPLCGAAWKVTDEHFDFRCEPCRIVSSLGSTRDEDDLARIGAWQAPVAAN